MNILQNYQAIPILSRRTATTPDKDTGVYRANPKQMLKIQRSEAIFSTFETIGFETRTTALM
jgi:hypothetical protein